MTREGFYAPVRGLDPGGVLDPRRVLRPRKGFYDPGRGLDLGGFLTLEGFYAPVRGLDLGRVQGCSPREGVTPENGS